MVQVKLELVNAIDNNSIAEDNEVCCCVFISCLDFKS